MTKTSALIPLVALGIVAAALTRPPSAQEQTDTKSQDKPKAQTESRPTAAADAPDDPFDALEVLAESFGVDISDAGLQRMVLREHEITEDKERSETRRGEAAKFGETFAALAREVLKLPKDSKPDYLSLVRQYFERKPLDTTTLRFRVLRNAAIRYETEVKFLIATLPDPIDSFTGWQFDPMLDAITQAVSASDYVFERYHFPDTDIAHASSDATARGRAHEGEASVVLFRRRLAQSKESTNGNGNGTDGNGNATNGKTWHRERLVLLIVHENPSAGVHARALINAIRVVTTWMNLETGKPRDPADSVVRILGPTFSGSADSIARELMQSSRRRYLDNYTVRVVSGSATDLNNKAILQDSLPKGQVTFRATVQPDQALMPKLLEQIKKARWSLPVAVLFEGNTQYGRAMLSTVNGLAETMLTDDPREFSPLILVPFPMNVSRVRVVQGDGKSDIAEVLGLPSKLRPLSMEMPGQPADQIPQLSPKTTSSYVELTLSGVLQTMRKEQIGTIALMATDPRDKLFLAQQIARDVPNASIFTAESDSVYIHPDYSAYMQGALIGSTYPLYSGNQRWSYGFQGGVERLEFANGSAKGIYNAALALLNYDEHGKPINREYAAGEGPPRLIEYGAPGEDCAKSCAPPVWISVVGRGGTWPVQAYRVPASDYVLRVTFDEPAAPASLATFPSPYFHGIFMVMTAAVLVFWAGARTQTWRRSQGFTGRIAALVSGSRYERGREYLLVGMASLLMMELFMAAVYITRARLDQPAWQWQGMGSMVAAVLVAITSVALADLARRITSRLLKHDRQKLNVRFGPGTWSGKARLAALTLCIWGAAALLYYAWTHAFEPRELAVGFTVRAMDFASGVSPTLPVLFLGFAIVLWSLAELARLRTPCVALADSSVHALMQQSIGTPIQRLAPAWNQLNRSTLSVPSPLVIVVSLGLAVTCLTLFDPIVRPLVTLEGPWFGRFVSSAILIVQVMISLSLLQFLYLWGSLKRLFDQMAWHRPVPAYEHVPRALCPPGLFPRTPRLMELQLLVAHWRGALGKAGRHDDRDKLTELFESEMRSADGPFWSESGTWCRLLAAAAEPPPSSAPLPSVQDRELLMEMCAALVVRDAIARLGHNLVFVIGGVLFVFCSHTLFPFQLDARLAELAWVYIALTFGSIVTVLVQMKRNEILRRLTSDDPTKRTGWDSEFFWRVAVFALIPLLTIFAAQFPDIGGVIMKWVDPVRKILP